MGHKSVSVDRDIATESRCDRGLCNTCDTVTHVVQHTWHRDTYITRTKWHGDTGATCWSCWQVDKFVDHSDLGSGIWDQQNFVKRPPDQQDGYRSCAAMPELSEPRGIWMSNPGITIALLVSHCCHYLIFDRICWLKSYCFALILNWWYGRNWIGWGKFFLCVAHFYPQGSFTFSHLATRSIIRVDAADCWNLHQTCVSGFCGLATCDIMVIHCQQFWMRQPILHCQDAVAHLAALFLGTILPNLNRSAFF